MGLKFENLVRTTLAFFNIGTSAVMSFDGSARFCSSNRKMKTGTKKSGLLTGLLVGTAFAASAIQVTYQVNMGMQIALGNFHPAADTVFVSGNFSSTNWEDTATDGSTGYILTPVAGNTNLYTGTFNMADLSAGNTEQHKFVINPGGNFSALDWELPYSTGTGNRSFVVPATATNLPAVYFNDQSPPVPFPFIAGVDFSDLQLYTDEGYVYKDGGKVEDGFSILTNHGINCVDLRIWTGTDALVKTNNPFNYTNNLTYTVPLAVRVKNAGLQFMLDFHYSDTWADPGHQFIPSEWTNNTTLPANLTNLVQQIYNYSSNTIAVFAASNAMPDYVQVGNEITAGMLWPVGEVSGSDNTSWSQLGQLMKAAIQGIQDAAGTKMPKIVVHIDRGGDWATTEWFFDNLRRQSVPFDIIGQSYYWNYQGALTNVITCLTNAAMRYGKPVLINENVLSLELLYNQYPGFSAHHERPG